MVELRKHSMRFYLTLFLFILTGVWIVSIKVTPHDHLKTAVDIPSEIGKWKSSDIPLDADALNLIQPDSYIFRSYQQGDVVISVYLGWYETMDKSDLAHSPLVCYSGQGWKVVEQDYVRIPLSDRVFVDARRMEIQKENQSNLAYYWYQTNHYTTGNLGKMRLRLFWQKILGQSEKNCFVRVSVAQNEGSRSYENDLKGFIRELSPAISRFF